MFHAKLSPSIAPIQGRNMYAILDVFFHQMPRLQGLVVTITKAILNVSRLHVGVVRNANATNLERLLFVAQENSMTLWRM